MDLEKQIETLNDLILINNDRVEGYQKGIEELEPEDYDLKELFQERIEQSKKFHDELVPEVEIAAKKVEQGTKTTGKIYRAWMDVKAFFGGNDRKVILDNCENGEDAALNAYDEALTCQYLTQDQLQMVIRHRADIKLSHDKIKALRDAQ